MQTHQLSERVLRLKTKDATTGVGELLSQWAQLFSFEEEDVLLFTAGGQTSTYTYRQGKLRKEKPAEESKPEVIVSVAEVRSLVGAEGRIADLVPQQSQLLIDKLNLRKTESLTVVQAGEDPLCFLRSVDGFVYVPEYPSKLKMLRNALTAAARVAVKPKLVSEEIFKVRMESCHECERWDSIRSRCTKCGCFTSAKLRLATERCPIGRWEKELL